MVWDVPLCIGVGWSCILYSAMEFSDGSSLPYWTRPMLDGLFALNLDLALDAIAIRLGFWNWGQGTEFQYFGVPYPNFWGQINQPLLFQVYLYLSPLLTPPFPVAITD
jgi:uncharacterized membrane protein